MCKFLPFRVDPFQKGFGMNKHKEEITNVVVLGQLQKCCHAFVITKCIIIISIIIIIILVFFIIIIIIIIFINSRSRSVLQLW